MELPHFSPLGPLAAGGAETGPTLEKGRTSHLAGFETPVGRDHTRFAAVPVRYRLSPLETRDSG